MKLVMSADEKGMQAQVSPIFGRCPAYVFVDSETMQSRSVSNPAQNTPGGAGIAAAQFVLSEGVDAVLTGNVGPNAAEVLAASGVPIYLIGTGTVEDAVRAFKEGSLARAAGASVTSHAGMGVTSQARPGADHEQAVSELIDELRKMRRQLADVMDRIAALEEE